jgi:hypothetical protein
MTTFPQNQHVSIAWRFLDKSEREFAADDQLNGAELLWGAAAHALIAVAQEHGWHYDSHGAFRNAVKALAALHQRPQWISDLDTAENFHIHFYHRRLTNREIAADRPIATRFVSRLLSLLVVK